MHKFAKIASAIILALAITGCASLKNPFVDGKFNSAVWKADMVAVKSAVKTGGQAVLDVMDELCPAVPDASTAVNDPTNAATAVAYLGSASAAQKWANNANDALTLFADACRTRNAASAKAVLERAAQAINDAKAIFASAKK
jgi:hypothetical protein